MSAEAAKRKMHSAQQEVRRAGLEAQRAEAAARKAQGVRPRPCCLICSDKSGSRLNCSLDWRVRGREPLELLLICLNNRYLYNAEDAWVLKTHGCSTARS